MQRRDWIDPLLQNSKPLSLESRVRSVDELAA